MNVLVTGASRGIGRALVENLSGGGHRVIALSRNATQLELLAKETSGEVLILPLDLTDANLGEKVQAALNEFGVDALDVLINNAGALVNKPFAEITEEDLLATYQVNVFGPFRLTQALLPQLKRAQYAHVVNIGSMGGVQGSAKFPGLSAYSSAKAAIAGLAECWAEELKEDGIKVNCLALGAAQTEMLEEAFPGYQAPLSAKEMANFIADFSLSSHQYMNGKVVQVALSTP